MEHLVPITTTGNRYSIVQLLRRYWRRTAVTWGLVCVEAMALVAMPAVIGWSVDDLLNDRSTGVVILGALCMLLLLVGAARRFYDTRAYAHIYRTVADELIADQRLQQTPLTAASARVSLFEEFIGFLEESIPSLLNELVALLGTLVLIAVIDIRVFLACLAAAGVTALVHLASESRMFRLNRAMNDESERKVDVLQKGDRQAVRSHLRSIARHQIGLSDLETANFAAIWLALSVVVVYTVVTISLSGSATMGGVIAAVMCVFGFAEAVLAFPLFYGQLVRLREVSARLSRPVVPVERPPVEAPHRPL